MLGCALQLLMAVQPLGCCFVGWVLRLRLLVASVAGSPAGGRDGAFMTLVLVVRCSSTSGAEIEFWRPGTLCWSLVPSTLRRLENLSVFLGFSRLWIRFSSSHCWSLLHWRHLSVFRLVSAVDCCLQPSGWRLRSSAAAAGSRAGIDGRLSSPPSGVVVSSVSSTLDALCIDRFSGQSWPILDFPLCEFSAGLCRFLLPSPLGACRSPLWLCTGCFSSLWFCLVVRI